jgi:hypothetical protein
VAGAEGSTKDPRLAQVLLILGSLRGLRDPFVTQVPKGARSHTFLWSEYFGFPTSTGGLDRSGGNVDVSVRWERNPNR